MKTIMCSTHFPKGHIREGQSTYFVENIWLGLDDRIFKYIGVPELSAHWNLYKNGLLSSTINDIKLHTVRNGKRWKVGDWASLRIWGGKPYGKGVKQIEFAQVEIKKVWDFVIERSIEFQGDYEISIDGEFFASNLIHCHTKTSLRQFAQNDGLTLPDFVSWFGLDKPIIKPFDGQIISWSDKVDY